MIVVTGAAGFIGSYMAGKLNQEGYHDLILVDQFTDPLKISNYISKNYSKLIDRDEFFEWLDDNHRLVELVIHLGARTDTIGQDPDSYKKLNFDYSQRIWTSCVEYGLPLIYASSASTYGDGEFGFDDDHQLIDNFKPLNCYAQSKHDFDLWALAQKQQPPFWAGLKFFNVFGPNEYHKGRMASVVYQAFNRISETQKMTLFRSHRPDFRDGEQARDFIYVEDVAQVMLHFMNNQQISGIFNVGTGVARTYLDLSRAVFKAMKIEADIRFVDTPKDIRNNYQYYTCAKIDKLRQAGYNQPFISLEDAIQDYVESYLAAEYCF
ncbi:ADP-glyceromanno-heptose 6-epimerase [Sunxiuqinia dokdonensis]|uniref:ADP-L-glycero-D-manno-heptose-6-epimerase n=1 Tax=Sunxiuqinia dokdonensis TaxID=1409788 RepID=A0A0L8V3A1_9BACT|nr:ADP-glyceromanno-heptose 6-epimerase [Sunxiuqinia dokdonensis]KOH42980.1 ADP-L-glycero-D-manno-heptose-6-epimerase [Sunxiuqinia dokdonensis]